MYVINAYIFAFLQTCSENKVHKLIVPWLPENIYVYIYNMYCNNIDKGLEVKRT